jgi:peptide/nickel transport system substrate-binding protein
MVRANKAARPVDRRKGVENAASFRANGTGPFRLRERQTRACVPPWCATRPTGARSRGNADEVIFTPIGNDATRVAALLSGEIDVMEPVPVQDATPVAAQCIEVMVGPELRTIFLGMDQKRDELLFSSVKGKNPFKDKRVRQAFYQAIDIEASRNRSCAVRPYRADGRPRHQRGFVPDEQAVAVRPDAAKKLLADAGYPNGFEVG